MSGRRLLGVLSFACLLLASGRLAAQTCEAGPNWVIRGRVEDAVSGVRLGFATVDLRTKEGAAGQSAKSAPDGAFVLCGVRPGEYRLLASLSDYRSAEQEMDLRGPGDTLLVSLALVMDPEATRGVVRGVVLDALTGNPIASAIVQLGEVGRRSTDQEGRFVFQDVPPGQYELRSTMLGYDSPSQRVALRDGEGLTTVVRLGADPLELPPVTVTTTRRQLDPPGFAGLETRVASGLGQFVLAEEVGLRNPTQAVDLLQSTGVSVLNGGRQIYMRRTLCGPTVYIDGVRVTHLPRNTSLTGTSGGDSSVPTESDPTWEAAEAVNLVSPSSIRAIEVYRGPGETPSQYLDSNARCGVILIWTWRGGTRR